MFLPIARLGLCTSQRIRIKFGARVVMRMLSLRWCRILSVNRVGEGVPAKNPSPLTQRPCDCDSVADVSKESS